MTKLSLAFRSPAHRKTAVLHIDVQGQFCDARFHFPEVPKADLEKSPSLRVTKRINQVSKHLRNAKVPTIISYMDTRKVGINKACGGLGMKTRKSDYTAFKTTISAFDSGNLRKLLHKEGFNNLWVTGFSVHACVRKTVEDALNDKFNVTVLSDCTGPASSQDYNFYDQQQEKGLKKLDKLGARVLHSLDVL